MTAFENADRARVAWWAVALALAGALAYTVYSFVGTFVFGVFVYYATRPVYRRLKRWIRPPTLAALVSLFTLALPVLLLVAYTTAVGLQELDAFLAARGANLGQLESLLGPYIDVSAAVEDPQSLLGEPSVQAALQTVAENAVGYAGFLTNFFVHLFAMITIAFYLLRDDHKLASWFRRQFGDDAGVVETYGRAVDRDFSHVFFGNILFAFVTGVIAAVSYSALDSLAPAGVGIPYPALLGMLTGVASLVPIVGIKLVYLPLGGWLAYLVVQQGGGYAFLGTFGVVAFVVVDVIPDLVLRPYVSGRDLHLGLVMLAYIFGPLLWGWYGLFLGPVVLVLVVHFVRIVLPELVAGDPIEPEALGPSPFGGDGSDEEDDGADA
ncbi:AI-2E family transporter [Halobacterium litoreum]|uniref:AI-2E family transporter n=1 Tax=Halobacterium litoreum TaxID=2039234 RepID=A0ABD5NCB7_9EURY|nr:AI-2E family transporter [Halobacterium litoreum]UHH14216.1 AI-2E family transporter [Halobacterium litoreum]